MSDHAAQSRNLNGPLPAANRGESQRVVEGQFSSTPQVQADTIGLQRLIGNRAVMRLRAAPARSMIQRVKIFVAGREGSRDVHINEYHFAHLLAQAKMTSSAEVGNHSVVVIPFTDFNGLGVAAGQAERKGEKSFEFGGVEWGWKNEHELFPIPNGKTCVDVAGAFFTELMMVARDGGIVSSGLKSDKAASAVLSALPKAKKSSKDEEETEDNAPFAVPFTFNVDALPPNVYYKPGGETKAPACFIYPMPYDQNMHHLHLFFESRTDSPVKTVKSMQLTSRKSDNHFGPTGPSDGKWQEMPDKQQRTDHETNLALLATVRRSTGGSEKAEKEPVELKTRNKWEGTDPEEIAETIGISLDQLTGYAEWSSMSVTDFDGLDNENFFQAYGETFQAYLNEREEKSEKKKEKPEKDVKSKNRGRRNNNNNNNNNIED